MAQVLDELAPGALNCDESRLDGNLDCKVKAVVSILSCFCLHRISLHFPHQRPRREKASNPIPPPPSLRRFLSCPAHLDHTKAKPIVSPPEVFFAVSFNREKFIAIGYNVPFSGTSKVSSL